MMMILILHVQNRTRTIASLRSPWIGRRSQFSLFSGSNQNISLKSFSAGFVERVERLTFSTLSSLAGYYLKTQAPYV